ncbi:MAG: hypothetical protein DWC02_01690 [Candidatus Poseidoniales archaeon]|nr:MAG: hypothetical protein DWC02_01690 [Candidatus Poseidoniales archaeon]
MQSLLVLTVDEVEATMGRGGSSDDFSVSEIEFNSSEENHWIQPDGSVVVYIAKGDIVDISVEVRRGGGALTGSSATVSVEMVHPIGYVMNSTSWETVPMLGGQSYTDSFTWDAYVAHSYLNVSSNELSGGIIIRATVFNSADDRNENDVMEKSLPVAIAQDDMDAEGDPRDQALPTASKATFYGGEYPIDGSDATGIGIWQEDGTSSAVGSANWRHSNAGSDYPSASRSRLVFAFRGADSNCGYGASLDGGLSQQYIQWMCKVQLNSAGLVSAQMHAQTWGQMGAGDMVALELWRGNGAPENTIYHNFAEDMPSTAAGSWSNISWDPTDQLGGHSWSYGILFQSDGSGASSGMHVDDFVMFGIEKVSEYTLDIDCDNPTGGYTTPPNTIVPMYCTITNNGYMGAQVRLQSNISNTTWMNPSLPMIRIDSDNPNQHGTNVILPVIPGGNTSEMWINLSIPAGADVQQQVWQVWWEDAGGTQLGEMGRIATDIAITEQYGVHLSSTAPLLATSLLPGESADIPFKLQNAGNREAGFTVTSNFQADNWVAYVTDLNHQIVQMPMPLAKGEQLELLLNVTAPEDSSPGEIPFSLRAVCPSCGQSLFGNDVISKKIDVPVLRELSMAAEELYVEAPANGNTRIVYVDLLNLGNDDEAYSLDLVESNWRLQASLSADETPVLDAWDGETSIALNLPMPIGLAPGLYTARITASSIDDPSVQEQITINVEVTNTSSAGVSDEVADQSYIPGGDPQSMRFEITNNGNKADRFVMSMDAPEGMNAQFEQLIGENLTPLLNPGESYNVTVTFTFDDDVNGQLVLKVIATSVNDNDVTSDGTCTYLVGSQNWLRIISTESIMISESGKVEVVVRVRNQYDAGQSVTMSIDQQGNNKWYSASIKNTDRDFWLEVEGEREVTIILDVPSSVLETLDEDYVDTYVKVWAKSNSVEESASLDLPITLKSVESTDDESAGSGSTDWVSVSIWIVGAALIISLLGVLLMVINSTEEEEAQQWDDNGYEDNLSATYGSVAAAPTVGAMGIEKAVPEISPPTVVNVANVNDVTTYDSATSGDVNSNSEVTGPPVPEAGLPEGWTMDQWAHYGQQWLDSQ